MATERHNSHFWRSSGRHLNAVPSRLLESERASRAAGAGKRPKAPTRERKPLFRTEAVAERQTQWLGSVLLAPNVSHRVFTFIGVLAASAIVALLYFAQYTRSARVGGWLVPHEGVVRVFAPRPGVVGGLQVAEGKPVKKGETLLTLSDELQSATLGATQVQVMQRLAEQRASLTQELAQQQRLLEQQQSGLNKRLSALRDEQEQVDREIELLRSRVAIAERSMKLHRAQFEQGFISEMRLQAVESELLEQRGRVGALQRSRLAAQRERLNVEAELADLPLKLAKDISAVQRSIAQLDQGRAEAEARREIVVPAPQDGTVTAIHAVPGARADTNAPLLSIVGADSKLEAHLYTPSRAVGFIRPGQRVLLRYDAYPHQSFGHHEGVVVSVSRAAISPSELPSQLASLASVSSPGGTAEPVYRVTVNLMSQTVQAYGNAVALSPGLALQADVTLERRRLYQWLLDPLYTITGRQTS
jgi:membrane fusion protein